MNNLDFETAAAEALCVWGREHHGHCVLEQHEGIVIVRAEDFKTDPYNNPLKVTAFETMTGLTVARWNVIGTELMNLYNAEVKCQKHQKH